ncbi:MAG: DUF790 family protein, partial [Kofleriaceae bacterium]|nr:DUF790 family protein [Kofleriaceae bacterium]
MKGAMELLEERDLDWVSYVADVVTSAVGKPWRVALERLESAPDAMSPRRHAAIVGAVQRVVGGRMRHAKDARKARELVLGHPALDADERSARVEAAAQTLALTTDALESLLWSDLPRERPIELPRGRPAEREIVAHANLALLQRAVRRAHAVTVRVWGDAAPLLRAANARGLLVSPWIGNNRETVVEIIGPLALCHRTAVYGRAISGIVPLLGACERFELAVAIHNQYGTYEARTRSPVLLPEPSMHLGGPSAAAMRLARELVRETRDAGDAAVTLAPPAVVEGGVVACPDLAVDFEGKRWLVELVGFWTTPYLERKLRGYGKANVVLCIDESRACADDAPPAEVLTYRKRI